MQFEQAKSYAVERLTQELSPSLVYHSLQHTCDDVVPAVELLASRHCVVGDDLIMLSTAAWFHDLGFIEQRNGHEAVGARIAAEILPDYDYGPAEIDQIQGIIMATEVPQKPRGLLEEIMADADLDLLGRDDFLKRNNDLRLELSFFGENYTDLEWFTGQLNFVSSHTYFTSAAQAVRSEHKALNLKNLQGLLNAASAAVQD
jgi:uncharacterized protein